MKWFRASLLYIFALALLPIPLALPAHAQQDERQAQPAKSEQLFALANETRSQAGLHRLQWDSALAEAAMKHCMRMATGGAISHRYPGELDLSQRAAEAGAHFGLIEENIAVGPYPATIHQQWMDSPPHRANLLSPDIDRIGIAVVASRGVLFAVADYARGVAQRSPSQVEAAIASLIRTAGVSVGNHPQLAREACAMDHGLPPSAEVAPPAFIMRWQDTDLTHLPHTLEQRLASGQYRRAEIGSCPATSSEGAFTAYRVAVLLY